MKTKNYDGSLEERNRRASIEAFVNEGGGGKPGQARSNPKGPLGVDPSDLTTAVQFDKARRSHR